MVVLGLAQRRGLGVEASSALDFLPMLAELRTVEALGVGGHHAVLDAVVHHLDEVTGAVATAVQVAESSAVWPVLGDALGGDWGMSPMPGAMVLKIGSRCFTVASEPPIIMQ